MRGCTPISTAVLDLPVGLEILERVFETLLDVVGQRRDQFVPVVKPIRIENIYDPVFEARTPGSGVEDGVPAGSPAESLLPTSASAEMSLLPA